MSYMYILHYHVNVIGFGCCFIFMMTWSCAQMKYSVFVISLNISAHNFSELSMEQQQLGCTSVTGWEFAKLTFLVTNRLWKDLTSVWHKVTLWYFDVWMQLATEQDQKHEHLRHCHIQTENQLICKRSVIASKYSSSEHVGKSKMIN